MRQRFKEWRKKRETVSWWRLDIKKINLSVIASNIFVVHNIVLRIRRPLDRMCRRMIFQREKFRGKPGSRKSGVIIVKVCCYKLWPLIREIPSPTLWLCFHFGIFFLFSSLMPRLGLNGSSEFVIVLIRIIRRFPRIN